jgi:tetrathionate reductase subunit B
LKKRFGLVIDQERCIGCEACSVACMLENKTGAPLIRVKTQNVEQQDTPEGRFPDLKMCFLPMLCNHCAHPPCVDVCPPGALAKRKDGPVVLDEEVCDGCQACIEACPFDAVLYDSEKEKAEKCSFCVHRIDRGLEPFCVICCEGQAIHFGDLSDPDSEVSRIISQKEAVLPEASGEVEPSVYYCPPRAPRGL